MTTLRLQLKSADPCRALSSPNPPPVDGWSYRQYSESARADFSLTGHGRGCYSVRRKGGDADGLS